SLVLEGLTMASGALFATGISAAATPELNGPTMPRILVFEIICWTFCAPLVGSCLPLTASSNGTNFSVKPSTEPFWATANWAPYCVGRPLDASAPETGRSLAMSISPLDVLPPPPDVPPQAKANTVAAVRTTSPLARTIWFPLVLLEGRAGSPRRLPSLAALFPTRVGARVRRRRVRPHGMAEPLLRVQLSTCRGPQVKSHLRARHGPM